MSLITCPSWTDLRFEPLNLVGTRSTASLTFPKQNGTRNFVFWLLLLAVWGQIAALNLARAETPGSQMGSITNTAPRFNVRAYVIDDRTLLPTNTLAVGLSHYTGPNVGLQEIVQAAADLQAAYRSQGYPKVSVAITRQQITNGIVRLRVFQGTVASQILVSGQRYQIADNVLTELANLSVASSPPTRVVSLPATNLPAQLVKAPPTVPKRVAKPLTPEQEALRERMAELRLIERKARMRPADTNPPPVQLILASAVLVDPGLATNSQATLRREMAELDRQARRDQLLPGSGTNSLSVSTNGPFFEVKGYELIGNSLLADDLTDLILRPYIRTNVTFDVIRRALTDLQTVYRERGFATVSVALPPQELTNGVVKVRVFQGRLSEIIVQGNRFFSSNNVMRTLPSLHEGMFLSSPVFQAELDRANANQDRQIYPQIEPGEEEKTTLLRLTVKDQLPLHGKTELNNQSSPGTPTMRVNSSLVYNNLWDLEHSVGLQYGFSPEVYKAGDLWNFYDRPLVANYSTFYRLPLGNQEAVEALVASKPGNFGYSEATRKFNLPPPSGRAELNVYASRSTSDTGVTTLSDRSVLDIPGVISIQARDFQQDLTVNGDLGVRLSAPLMTTADFQSGFSGGLDYKTYKLTSYKTNNFIFSIITRDAGGNVNPPIDATVSSPNPPPYGQTVKELDYLPLAFGYNASLRDAHGVTTFGVGLSGNAWYSGSRSNLQAIAGSSKSTGHWLVATPSVSRDFIFHTNWTLSLRANAQWASQPLISNEQFGAGGVESVRGYHEGEVFGDKGWRANIDLKTPPQVIGIAYAREALTVRGSLYMDYAETYYLDPQGRQSPTPLWGCGFGAVISVGSHWDARLLFSWPLISTSQTGAGQPRFNFGLTGQF